MPTLKSIYEDSLLAKREADNPKNTKLKGAHLKGNKWYKDGDVIAHYDDDEKLVFAGEVEEASGSGSAGGWSGKFAWGGDGGDDNIRRELIPDKENRPSKINERRSLADKFDPDLRGMIIHYQEAKRHKKKGLMNFYEREIAKHAYQHGVNTKGLERIKKAMNEN